MSAKHTPGPWSWAETSSSMNMPCLTSPSGEICNFGDDTQYYPTEGIPPNEANARLIAAAPELLEAAKLVLAWYEAEDNHAGTDFYQRIQMCRDSEAAVRAAIAKATGGQQ